MKAYPHPQWEDKGTYKQPTPSTDNVRVPRLEVDNATTYIDKDGSDNLTLTDAVTGTKTLAQLSAAGTGTVDTSGTPVDDDFAKFTDADTIEGRSYVEVKTDLSLNLVENTAHSTDVHTMTIDGRDVSVDGTKLDTIATNADVTGSNAPQAHTASHTDGTDDIRDATNALKGLATAAQITKLEGIATGATVYPDTGEQAFLDADHTKLDAIEASADVTDATNVDAAGAVMEADYNAQTVLAATTDDTPAALTVGEQTVVGRIAGGNVAALTVAQLQTLLLSAAFPENSNIEWDNALSADGKWSGIVTKQFNGGATIPFGEVVYLKAADSEWYQAKADVTATSGAVMIGICVLATTDGNACTVLLNGKVRADAKFPTFTISAPVFISAATAGLLTSTAPSGTANFVVRIVGHALTGDEIYVHPDNSYVELAS